MELQNKQTVRMPMDDDKIVELYWERDEKAIEETDFKYKKYLFSIAYNVVHDRLDCEECLNDTYLGAWNAIPPTRPNNFMAFICRITRNLSLKKYYSNTAQKRNNYYDVVLEEIAECLESKRNIEEEILAKELEEEINYFLGSLKKKERVLFVLRYWYCFTPVEIGDKMHMTTNAVTVHLYRTRKKLQKYLKEKEI